MKLAGNLLRSYFSHGPINHKIRAIHKAAFVAGKEEDGLSLLDRFTEAACWEMDFATMALCCVVAEPVLEEWCAV
jgi:hypothetical protein